jgi:hypothetical protein
MLPYNSGRHGVKTQKRETFPMNDIYTAGQFSVRSGMDMVCLSRLPSEIYEIMFSRWKSISTFLCPKRNRNTTWFNGRTGCRLFRNRHSCPTTCHGGTWGERGYSSYSFLTLAPDGGEWSVSRSGCTLAAEKRPLVPTGQEDGWAPELVWTQRLEEKFATARDRTQIAQSSNL